MPKRVKRVGKLFNYLFMKTKLLNLAKSKVKTTLTFLVVFLSMSMVLFSCIKDDEEDEIIPSETENLVGQEGNPRFNLVFTNQQNVDLDLYVKAPNGTIVSYLNPSAAGGTLDVDCLCNGCPQGPNENIFWQSGTAPTGTYQYWVKYYGSCGGTTGQSSSYTLKVTRNGQILATKTGTLSSGQQSVTFSHVQ